MNAVTAPSSAWLTLSVAPCCRYRRRRRRRRARGELLRRVRAHLADGQPVVGTVPAQATVQPLDGPRFRLGRQRGDVPLAARPATAHAAVRLHVQNGRLGSASAFAGETGLEAARRTAFERYITSQPTERPPRLAFPLRMTIPGTTASCSSRASLPRAIGSTSPRATARFASPCRTARSCRVSAGRACS